MAIIPQKRLFGWEEIDELGDLERLRLVLEYLPDERLMEVLEKDRDRDDYPVRAVWNSILAGIVFQHESVERVNSRLDVSFGFERHFIRGLNKMKLKLGLALCVMLAMALGRAKENQPEKIRSLVWSVAA
jgi:hypothetical protein